MTLGRSIGTEKNLEGINVLLQKMLGLLNLQTPLVQKYTKFTRAVPNLGLARSWSSNYLGVLLWFLGIEVLGAKDGLPSLSSLSEIKLTCSQIVIKSNSIESTVSVKPP